MDAARPDADHIRVNGEDHRPDDRFPVLLDFLRERLGLTGAKRSCDMQVCGACTVLVDGDPVSSCCSFTRDAAGSNVETIEGLLDRPVVIAMVEVFTRLNTFQCGFCTPGFVTTLIPLLEEDLLRSRRDVIRELSGNICRCTGYQAIIEAVCEIAGVDENCDDAMRAS